MKRILFLITGMGIGGAERQICSISDELVTLGYEVMIICMTGDVLCRPKNKSIKTIEIRMTKSIINVVHNYFFIRNIINEYKPDVIHSHMIHANIFSRLLRLSIKMPTLVNTAHSKNEGGAVRMLAYRYTDFLTDLSTNVSQEAVDEFVAKGAVRKNKMCAVHNGIDHEKFTFNPHWRIEKRKELGLDPSIPLLLAVGRLTSAKDYPNLLHAFALLDMEVKPHLAIIGSGELENQLKEIANDLKCTDRIHWLGLQQNVEKWYPACDVFVLSSQWEGFGLVVAEAMAAERPVVVTDAGGVAEVVGDHNLIVPISNSEALADKITEVLNYSDEDIKIVVSKNRQRVINNFSIKKIVQQWLKIYKV